MQERMRVALSLPNLSVGQSIWLFLSEVAQTVPHINAGGGTGISSRNAAVALSARHSRELRIFRMSFFTDP
jgi:hypothetical protein